MERRSWIGSDKTNYQANCEAVGLAVWRRVSEPKERSRCEATEKYFSQGILRSTTARPAEIENLQLKSSDFDELTNLSSLSFARQIQRD